MRSKEKEDIDKVFDEENIESYVLITCTPATENGDMRVKMTYQGDLDVISYMLNGAQSIIDQKGEDEES